MGGGGVNFDIGKTVYKKKEEEEKNANTNTHKYLRKEIGERFGFLFGFVHRGLEVLLFHGG